MPSKSTLAAITILAATILTLTRPMAAVSTTPTPRQIEQRCDAYTYFARSPDRTICRYLRHAAITEHVPQTWASNPALLNIIARESGFAYHAVNRSSGACGLGQMLPCSKYGHGSCWPSLYRQAWCVVHYIHGRYHTPESAWAFWRSRGWY